MESCFDIAADILFQSATANQTADAPIPTIATALHVSLGIPRASWNVEETKQNIKDAKRDKGATHLPRVASRPCHSVRHLHILSSVITITSGATFTCAIAARICSLIVVAIVA
jgi:hypothetical protein